MFGHLGAVCCCDGETPAYPSAVLIHAHLGIIVAEGSWQTCTDPRDPADGDPGTAECAVSPGALTCMLACGTQDNIPPDTQIVCPDGVSLDAPRPWGTGSLIEYKGREWYFRDDPLTLPLDTVGTDSGSNLAYKRVPPGGGASVTLGLGDWECDYYQYYAEPTQLVPTEVGDCVLQIDGESDSVLEPVNAEYRGRKRWIAPPTIFKVKAPTAGWTLGIASATLTVVDASAVTHTKDLTTVDIDGAVSWLAGLGLTVTDAGGGTWSSEPAGPFDADLLGDQSTAAIPSGASPARSIWIHNVGESVTMDGDDDHGAEPYWTVTILDDIGATKVASEAGWHRFSGTEADFLWGFATDFSTGDYLETINISVEDFGYNGPWGNILPIPGADFGGAPWALIAPSAATSVTVCWTDSSTTTGPTWDQDPGDCWIACRASASRSLEGGVALWMLVGVA